MYQYNPNPNSSWKAHSEGIRDIVQGICDDLEVMVEQAVLYDSSSKRETLNTLLTRIDKVADGFLYAASQVVHHNLPNLKWGYCKLATCTYELVDIAKHELASGETLASFSFSSGGVSSDFKRALEATRSAAEDFEAARSADFGSS